MKVHVGGFPELSGRSESEMNRADDPFQTLQP
jgi:hypothetical protein